MYACFFDFDGALHLLLWQPSRQLERVELLEKLNMRQQLLVKRHRFTVITLRLRSSRFILKTDGRSQEVV